MEISCLLGKDCDHICHICQRIGLHRDVVPAYKKMQGDAAMAGFDMQIASGFRAYARQQHIWDQKLLGDMPLLDDHGCRLARETLSDCEKIYAVLRWSALPGASRHHWGTDIDIFDANGLDDGDLVQLTPDEYAFDGKFGAFSGWLGRYLDTPACPFFRPYDVDRGGVAPEPWHVSYSPLADRFQGMLTRDVLRAAVEAGNVAMRECILVEFDQIFERFVQNVSVSGRLC